MSEQEKHKLPPSEDNDAESGEPPVKRRKIEADEANDAGDAKEGETSEALQQPTDAAAASEQKVTKEAAKEPVIEEDILVNGWLYYDSFGKRQGPFTTVEMQEWKMAGYLLGDVKVKRVNDETWTTIAQVPLLNESPPPRPVYPVITQPFPQYQTPQPVQLPAQPAYGTAYERPPERPVDTNGTYVQTAAFSALGGRFKAQTPEEHWSSRGLADDKAGRMMAHYFNVDHYQEEMRLKAQAPKKHVKLTKAQLNFFKKRKDQKRARNILK